MRIRRCPRCEDQSGRFLADASRLAGVDYYECNHCGEIWIVDPMNPTRPLRGSQPEELKSGGKR